MTALFPSYCSVGCTGVRHVERQGGFGDRGVYRYWPGGGAGAGREGARVVVSDIYTENGEKAVTELRTQGHDALFVHADVGDPEACEALVERVVRHYGRLDVACNNAGIGGEQLPTADYPLDAWDKVIRTNLSGVFYGMKYQIAAMLKNGGGGTVKIASILGAVGFTNAPAYSAAK